MEAVKIQPPPPVSLSKTIRPKLIEVFLEDDRRDFAIYWCWSCKHLCSSGWPAKDQLQAAAELVLVVTEVHGRVLEDIIAPLAAQTVIARSASDSKLRGRVHPVNNG